MITHHRVGRLDVSCDSDELTCTVTDQYGAPLRSAVPFGETVSIELSASEHYEITMPPDLSAIARADQSSTDPRSTLGDWYGASTRGPAAPRPPVLFDVGIDDYHIMRLVWDRAVQSHTWLVPGLKEVADKYAGGNPYNLAIIIGIWKELSQGRTGYGRADREPIEVWHLLGLRDGRLLIWTGDEARWKAWRKRYPGSPWPWEVERAKMEALSEAEEITAQYADEHQA